MTFTRQARHNPLYLPGKLVEFFEANPDESLTFEDIRTKWGCSVAAVSMAVQGLVTEGILEDVPRQVRAAKRHVKHRNLGSKP